MALAKIAHHKSSKNAFVIETPIAPTAKPVVKVDFANPNAPNVTNATKQQALALIVVTAPMPIAKNLPIVMGEVVPKIVAV